MLVIDNVEYLRKYPKTSGKILIIPTEQDCSLNIPFKGNKTDWQEQENTEFYILFES